MNTIFTIGYERHSPDSFLEVLRANGVTLLLDIRDLPNSRKRGFAKTKLSEALGGAGIRYESVRALGNPKANRTLWRADLEAGQAEFEKILDDRDEELDAVAQRAQSETIALMCLEADPLECHRSLVGRRLAQRGVLVQELS